MKTQRLIRKKPTIPTDSKHATQSNIRLYQIERKEITDLVHKSFAFNFVLCRLIF